MSENKITVIVPVHNSAGTLTKCVNSILYQSYDNLEIFLVNNGSTDDSLQICQMFARVDERVKLINLDEGNVSKARNAALERMTGEYFAFVDSDDFVESSMYEKLYLKAKSTQADMVFCYFNTVDGDHAIKPYIEKNLKELVYNKQFQHIFKSDDNYVKANIWRTLFKSETLKDNRFDDSLFFGEDFVFMFQAFQHTCNMALVEECLYNYTLAPTTMSKKYFNAKMLQNDKIYAEYAYHFLSAFGMTEYAVAARYRSWIHVVHSVLAYSENYKEELHAIRSDSYWKKVIEKENYTLFLKLLCPCFKYKVRAFLLQHGLFTIYRFFIKRMI